MTAASRPDQIIETADSLTFLPPPGSGPNAVPVIFEQDFSAFDAVVSALAGEAPSPALDDLLRLVEEDFGACLDLDEIDLGRSGAGGARKIVVRAKPSQRFETLLAAVFAAHPGPGGGGIAHLGSFVGSVARPTIEQEGAVVTAAAPSGAAP